MVHYRSSDDDYMMAIISFLILGQYYDIYINGISIKELTEEQSLFYCESGSIQFVFAQDKKKKRKLDSSSRNWKQNGEEKVLKNIIPLNCGIGEGYKFLLETDKQLKRLSNLVEKLKISKRTLTLQENGGNFKLWEFAIQLDHSCQLGFELLLRHYLLDDKNIISSIKYTLDAIKISVGPIQDRKSSSINYPSENRIPIKNFIDIREIFCSFHKLNPDLSNRFETKQPLHHSLPLQHYQHINYQHNNQQNTNNQNNNNNLNNQNNNNNNSHALPFLLYQQYKCPSTDNIYSINPSDIHYGSDLTKMDSSSANSSPSCSPTNFSNNNNNNNSNNININFNNNNKQPTSSIKKPRKPRKTCSPINLNGTSPIQIPSNLNISTNNNYNNTFTFNNVISYKNNNNFNLNSFDKNNYNLQNNNYQNHTTQPTTLGLTRHSSESSLSSLLDFANKKRNKLNSSGDSSDNEDHHNHHMNLSNSTNNTHRYHLTSSTSSMSSSSSLTGINWNNRSTINFLVNEVKN